MLPRFTIGVQDSGLRAAGFRFQCVLGLEFVCYRVEVQVSDVGLVSDLELNV